MSVWKEIDLRNIAIDLAVTLVAINFIDLSRLVEVTLPFAIYLLIPLQSFALFLVYGDLALDDMSEREAPENRIAGFKRGIEVWLRAFAMFSWILGFMWVLIPIQYLDSITGSEYYWARPLAFFVGLFTGMVLLVRFFANGGSESDTSEMGAFRSVSWKHSTWPELLILPVYGFLVYGNLWSPIFRQWIAWAIAFALIIYAETVYEIVVNAAVLPLPWTVFGLFFSYFPMRMLLLVRTPFSLTELLTALLAFGIFLYTLVT